MKVKKTDTDTIKLVKWPVRYSFIIYYAQIKKISNCFGLMVAFYLK